MEKHLDIAVYQANMEPVKGKQLYWVLSRKQVEHIVGDLEKTATKDQAAHVSGFFNWQGLNLPVVNLEKFSRLSKRQVGENIRGIVVKTSVQAEQGVAARVILETTHRLNMIQVSSTLEPAPIRRDELASRNLKGLYMWEEDKLLAVPNLEEIISRSLPDSP